MILAHTTVVVQLCSNLLAVAGRNPGRWIVTACIYGDRRAVNRGSGGGREPVPETRRSTTNRGQVSSLLSIQTDSGPVYTPQVPDRGSSAAGRPSRTLQEA